MTFCLTMKVKDGLVGIADTRITTGNECSTARKVTIYQTSQRHSMFLMTSGLRSVRDKALTYFKEILEEEGREFNKLYKLVNAFADQVKRVADEDGKLLKERGFNFNLNALVAGQLCDDSENKLYMLYPEGNWVEVGENSPFFIIGNSGYGKPLLNRVINFNSSMGYALKAGVLAFDSTRVCANDVGYPIDIILYKNNSFRIVTHRFDHSDLDSYSRAWQQKISQALDDLPDEWVASVFAKFQ
ncbi:peptidase [bacterium]|nr:peptidase [bacterium]MCP5461931.1 peptidase [bacterium]